MVEALGRPRTPDVTSSETTPGIIRLAPEEMQFLQGLADGLTYQQIGERLGINSLIVKRVELT